MFVAVAVAALGMLVVVVVVVVAASVLYILVAAIADGWVPKFLEAPSGLVFVGIALDASVSELVAVASAVDVVGSPWCTAMVSVP